MMKQYPQVRRMAAVANDAERLVLESLNIYGIIERGQPRGVELVSGVLEYLGRSANELSEWPRRADSLLIQSTDIGSPATQDP